MKDTGVTFALETADVDALVPSAQTLNSMLTKLHALYAEDGLPIYGVPQLNPSSVAHRVHKALLTNALFTPEPKKRIQTRLLPLYFSW